MDKIALFTDVSLDPKTKNGMGAFAFFPLSFLDSSIFSLKKTHIIDNTEFKLFSNTSSTKLEVETVLFALHYISTTMNLVDNFELTIYTDSQCVAGLLDRRYNLESKNFISSGSGKLHKNTELYKEFYKYFDIYKFKVYKVIGHLPSEKHDTIHRIFSFIDQEVRTRFRQSN